MIDRQWPTVAGRQWPMVRVADEKGMGMNVGKENEINQKKKNGRKRKKRRVEVAVVLEGLFLENGECGFSGL